VTDVLLQDIFILRLVRYS